MIPRAIQSIRPCSGIPTLQNVRSVISTGNNIRGKILCQGKGGCVWGRGFEAKSRGKGVVGRIEGCMGGAGVQKNYSLFAEQVESSRVGFPSKGLKNPSECLENSSK